MDPKQDNIHKAAKGLVAALVETQAEGVMLRLYHDMVEALIHPYNRDALDNVRKAVGMARQLRDKHGHGSKNSATASLVLDGEAVLAQLGVEPIFEDDAPYRQSLDVMVGQAEEFLRHNVPGEVFEPDVSTPTSLPN